VVLRALVGEVDSAVVGESATFWEIFDPLLVRTFPFNLLVYGVIVAASHALDYYRKYHERTVQTLELEKHLTEARLQALLHQLKPHFLFNTLNGIASLMHTDVDAADRMLVRLSELLRITMSHTGAPQTTLREEVAFLERYLDIEKIRFRNRLEVVIAIDDDAIDAQVPSLILQPIVENAVRHGIEPQSRPGKIELRGRAAEDGRLVLTVSDNGGGIPAGGPSREGIGLANTRARLAELYGTAAAFRTGQPPGRRPVCADGDPLQHLRAVTKLRILIADDEPLARARLLALLPKDVAIEIVGEYASGTEAVEAIRRDKPDIAFLDMQMPGCDGLQVVGGLAPEERPAIVFVTAHDKFAVDAFGVRAVDYVLKPFDRERLETALERAAEYVSARRAAPSGRGSRACSPAPARRSPRSRSASRSRRTAASSSSGSTRSSGSRRPTTTSSSTPGRRAADAPRHPDIDRGALGPQQFTRANRSALVRIDQVKELQPSAQGDYNILLRNGTLVPLSRALRGASRNS
jgi:DNA-binding LytR/AlgR family response regulator